ncbi:GntR family transcriptional regulator [Spirosoma sp. HMF4905]|uniref:GntR family transcriptional regulator n=1 Tax=Spirosoma arboris TaxID=2682092 RepID=A0A7K1SMN5_9BACT|nr:GntR family transcriptional regulator [Spirosoma arboris]MVM35064.1 GntR family transcriptional regulator [Spirosoma arboris]
MKENKSKYKLIVSHVTDRIDSEEYKKGDWIPSINEFRDLYNLSRDTVYAGLRELRLKGIIESNPGVGNFVTSTKLRTGQNIFLLFNEFNEFKEDLYNSFVEAAGKAVTIDLYFHNYNRKVFETLVNDANGKYTTYIIMSGKFQGIEPLLQTLTGRVFLLDHFHPELTGKYSSVFQNFEKDTYEALVFGLPHIKKYTRIYMVQKEEKEPQERYKGLEAFCRENKFGHDYFDTVKNRSIQKGDLFMVVNDKDLVDLLKQADHQNMIPGLDFGIISYNDTPLKEILAGGITTLSTDFTLMGKTMADLIQQKTVCTIENPWKLNVRKSL